MVTSSMTGVAPITVFASVKGDLPAGIAAQDGDNENVDDSSGDGGVVINEGVEGVPIAAVVFKESERQQ